jgi:sec-independent protein translocase protein TatC
MLAVPMWLLYELGILVAAMITKPRPEAEADYTPMSVADMDDELDRIETGQAEPGSRDPK